MLDSIVPFRTVARITLALLAATLIAPWIVFSFVAAGVRVVYSTVRGYRAARAALIQHALCPRGHRSDLLGVFECRCGALFAGWAFERCPVCYESCGYVSCEHCGLSVRNPVLVAIEPRRWRFPNRQAHRP
jgi:hypothetical protein